MQSSHSHFYHCVTVESCFNIFFRIAIAVFFMETLLWGRNTEKTYIYKCIYKQNFTHGRALDNMSKYFLMDSIWFRKFKSNDWIIKPIENSFQFFSIVYLKKQNDTIKARKKGCYFRFQVILPKCIVFSSSNLLNNWIDFVVWLSIRWSIVEYEKKTKNNKQPANWHKQEKQMGLVTNGSFKLFKNTPGGSTILNIQTTQTRQQVNISKTYRAKVSVSEWMRDGAFCWVYFE